MTMRTMKPYSNDLCRKIVEAYESGDLIQDEVADLFGVSNATVRNFIRRKRNTGSCDALPHADGRRATLADTERERLRQLASENDDATLTELCRYTYRVSGWLASKTGGSPSMVITTA